MMSGLGGGGASSKTRLQYSAIQLMDHRIMVQFNYWFKFRLVPNKMYNLLCKNIRLKV